MWCPMQASAALARLARSQGAAAREAERAKGFDAHANVPASVPRPPLACFEHRGKAGAVF